MRASKQKRFSKQFTIQERADRNNRQLYTVMPSPLGVHWQDYIRHKLRMMKNGISTYTSKKMTRLNLDKYIETSRAMDKFIGKLVNYDSALIFLGTGETPPNSPIRIKKHIRCPGNRKLVTAAKKRRNVIILPQDEYFTSQTCGMCFGRFDPRTKSHKFKVCQDCRPTDHRFLPEMIITQLGKRDLQRRNEIYRMLNIDAQPNQPNAGSLMTKVQMYRKNWQENPDTGVFENGSGQHFYFEEESDPNAPQKRVWQRDVVAAKCILVKGKYCVI